MAGLRNALPKLLTAFPDLTAEFKQEMAVADRVATHWVLRGTHTGEIFGIPATGKTVQFQNINIARVEQSRIVQFNSEAGWLSVLMQIGALPVKPAATPSTPAAEGDGGE